MQDRQDRQRSTWRDHLGAGRALVLQHVLHQVDAAARAVALVAEQDIGRAGGGAEAAVDAGADRLFRGGHGGSLQLFGAEAGLHGLSLPGGGGVRARPLGSKHRLDAGRQGGRGGAFGLEASARRRGRPRRADQGRRGRPARTAAARTRSAWASSPGGADEPDQAAGPVVEPGGASRSCSASASRQPSAGGTATRQTAGRRPAQRPTSRMSAHEGGAGLGLQAARPGRAGRPACAGVPPEAGLHALRGRQ